MSNSASIFTPVAEPTSGYTSQEVRQHIWQLHKQGYTQKQIARRLYLAPSTVNLWINRQGQVDTQKKTGRRRKTTLFEDNRIFMLSTNDPFLAATDINRQLQLQVSPQTVRNRLGEKGFKNFKTCVKPFLSEDHKNKRLEFAERYSHWTPQKWEKVCVADEKCFQSFGNGSPRVWRPKSSRWDQDEVDESMKITRYHESVLVYRKKSSRFSIAIWGCIGYKNRLHLITAKHLDHKYYMRHILNKYLKNESEDPIHLLQDRSRIHTANACKRWYDRNNVIVLKWPSYSPDLNPIENLWSKMEHMTRNRNPTSREDLWDTVLEAFEEIAADPNYIKNLLHSMPKRLHDVIQANGNFTKY